MKNKKNILIIAVLLLSIFSCRKMDVEKQNIADIEKEDKIVGNWWVQYIQYSNNETEEVKKHIECFKQWLGGLRMVFNKDKSGLHTFFGPLPFTWNYDSKNNKYITSIGSYYWTEKNQLSDNVSIIFGCPQQNFQIPSIILKNNMTIYYEKIN